MLDDVKEEQDEYVSKHSGGSPSSGSKDEGLSSKIDKILNETKLKVSIEAGSRDCWKKYVGDFGMTFGIDVFGKSAPYKDIYKYFGLISSNIVGKLKNKIKN